MKQKGFTLVELLAVIVVLAIIALISVPILLNVIDKAKKGAVKDSVYGVEEAANLYYAQNYTTGVSGLYNIKEDNIKYKGSVDKGLVYYGDNGLTTILIYDGKYCGYKYQNSEPEVGNVVNNKCIIKDKAIEESELTKVDSDGSYVAGGMNGTEPVISGNLIPITIENDGTVKKADTSSKWYNYYEKKWANAVILKDESISYNNNEIIPESNIESYFVWIPRYRYKLWNTGAAIKNKHEIEIIFENKDTQPTLGTNNGEWLTHPAFTTFNSNGIWVGKFETGYDTATTTAAAQVSSSDSTKIIVKPNVFSWRNNTVYNMFLSSYNYNRELDSHMMKNTEWGAVAYLSHSKFGLGYEVNINNNSSYKTGYSALPSTNQQTYPGTYGDGATYNSSYNTQIGYLASTTGNITGIYDMSGGSYEYMASYRSGTIGSSGFTTTTIANYDTKYFDVYNASSSVNSYQYRILGDATGEMGPFKQYLDGDNNSRWHNSWYADASDFVESSYPWFHRGGNYDNGVLAGQFYFDKNTGGVYTHIGSRLVLTVN